MCLLVLNAYLFIMCTHEQRVACMVERTTRVMGLSCRAGPQDHAYASTKPSRYPIPLVQTNKQTNTHKLYLGLERWLSTYSSAALFLQPHSM